MTKTSERQHLQHSRTPFDSEDMGRHKFRYGSTEYGQRHCQTGVAFTASRRITRTRCTLDSRSDDTSPSSSTHRYRQNGSHDREHDRAPSKSTARARTERSTAISNSAKIQFSRSVVRRRHCGRILQMPGRWGTAERTERRGGPGRSSTRQRRHIYRSDAPTVDRPSARSVHSPVRRCLF